MESSKLSPGAQACDSCRVRKLKCTKEYPTCSKCKEHGWKCVYSPKIVRSPLTRAYLTQVENKANTLEKILKRMIPEDVEVLELIRMAESEKQEDEELSKSFFTQVNLTPNDLSKQPVTLKSINDLSEQIAKHQPKQEKHLEYQPEDYLINIKNTDLNFLMNEIIWTSLLKMYMIQV